MLGTFIQGSSHNFESVKKEKRQFRFQCWAEVIGPESVMYSNDQSRKKQLGNANVRLLLFLPQLLVDGV